MVVSSEVDLVWLLLLLVLFEVWLFVLLDEFGYLLVFSLFVSVL